MVRLMFEMYFSWPKQSGYLEIHGISQILTHFHLLIDKFISLFDVSYLLIFLPKLFDIMVEI